MENRIRLWKSTVRSQRGMTLIEIMVVIAIIGMVASAVGFGVTKFFSDAKEKSATIQLEKVATVLTQYQLLEDEYPSSLEDLTKKGKKGQAGYLEQSNLKDPWKTKLIYSVSGDTFKLCSAGPDKREGTDDDQCFGESSEE